MPSQWEFIEEAAHMLGIAAETVRKWRVRGVPGRYRLPIVQLANRHGRQVDPKIFDQPPGPRRRGRPAAPAGPTKSPPAVINRDHQRNRRGSKMAPEDSICQGEARPFTGAEYIESLRDGREVYIDGERVADVTTHPAFRNSVRSLARLYDALHDPKTKEVLTAPTDTGSAGYTHKYFRVARSREELIAQQRAIACWSRLTYGWMGRTPDYKASLMNTLG